MVGGLSFPARFPPFSPETTQGVLNYPGCPRKRFTFDAARPDGVPPLASIVWVRPATAVAFVGAEPFVPPTF